jgi:hypothetical protein
MGRIAGADLIRCPARNEAPTGVSRRYLVCCAAGTTELAISSDSLLGKFPVSVAARRQPMPLARATALLAARSGLWGRPGLSPADRALARQPLPFPIMQT